MHFIIYQIQLLFLKWFIGSYTNGGTIIFLISATELITLEEEPDEYPFEGSLSTLKPEFQEVFIVSILLNRLLGSLRLFEMSKGGMSWDGTMGSWGDGFYNSFKGAHYLPFQRVPGGHCIHFPFTFICPGRHPVCSALS